MASLSERVETTKRHDETTKRHDETMKRHDETTKRRNDKADQPTNRTGNSPSRLQGVTAEYPATRTNFCVAGYAVRSLHLILFIHSVKLKKFSTKKTLNRSIKAHRRALVLLLCLIPCHRCEKSA